MRPFAYARADSAADAVRLGTSPPSGLAAGQFLAGGTTLLDLMKLDVMRPERLIDINGLEQTYGGIEARADGLQLGALVRMTAAAEHEAILRDYPVIAQALRFAASPQIRNMATLGGNVLQRTRCTYFRDPSFTACNKRNPGSGCAALGGVNRRHAVLGVSDRCIATYPGDFGQALVALQATVDITGPNGDRRIPFEELHRLPGETPNVETSLAPGDLITGFHIPAGAWTRRSVYLKTRDRAAYEFALASAAVALDIRDGVVREARIGLGGVASKPWRAREAESLLQNRPFDDATAKAAAEAAFATANSQAGNAFKPELGRRTLVRALRQAASLEI